MVIAETETLDTHVAFPKISRYSRECIITEKLDGTNAQILITEDGQIRAGSRNRWITVGDDNYGFAKWVEDNKAELLHLGPGRHFGEWWGVGIQRNYGLSERRFSLFNTTRFSDPAKRPKCCHVVPALGHEMFCQAPIDFYLHKLETEGSVAAPGFMKPEGLVIYHLQANVLFKKTLEADAVPKGVSCVTPI